MGRRTFTDPPAVNPCANMMGDENYRRAVAAQTQQADYWPPASELLDQGAIAARRRDVEGRSGPYVPLTPSHAGEAH